MMKVLCGLALALSVAVAVSAQTATVNRPATAPAAPASVAAVVPPADYTVGPDDVLSVVFWRDKDMSADVTVRPDGRITLPLLNEVSAAGLTLEQLRQNIKAAAEKFVDDPSVTVDVKAINSRKVFITGEVGKPGPYALMGPTTVMQLLAMAGGVNEYAKADNISILRTENGKQVSMRFNYKDVLNRKNLKQNIELKPGDTVVVP
ncbi:MAG TPA: polysaccharide biosynthesis/export family protein [Vicinamibacterales bacterium]|nr:polysaccharide biosynthesis/export family protein [Vicinamibacterales bacterium]